MTTLATTAHFLALRHGTRTRAATSKGVEIEARLADVVSSQMVDSATASVASPHLAAWIHAFLTEVAIDGRMLR